jgi:hypothetical protein
MAQQSISVDSSAASPAFVTQCLDPNATGLYSFTAFDIAGVVAATNHVSLFNPSGSGKTLNIYALTYSSYVSTGSAALRSSMAVIRANTIAAGTLQAASTINRFRTSYPNAIAEVRTNNPTATLDGSIIAFPQTNTVGTFFMDRVTGSSPGGSIALAPGEGIVWRSLVGDTDTNTNISFTWSET